MPPNNKFDIIKQILFNKVSLLNYNNLGTKLKKLN